MDSGLQTRSLKPEAQSLLEIELRADLCVPRRLNRRRRQPRARGARIPHVESCRRVGVGGVVDVHADLGAGPAVPQDLRDAEVQVIAPRGIQRGWRNQVHRIIAPVGRRELAAERLRARHAGEDGVADRVVRREVYARNARPRATHLEAHLGDRIRHEPPVLGEVRLDDAAIRVHHGQR